MVYFTCNHCGESLKKASVEKHYYGRCQRAAKFLTCVDCMKDFRGEEYDSHTKCITEDEKYSAKGFKSNSPSVKGENKQLSWLELIQYVCKNKLNIPREQSLLLVKLCAHSNVPQKKAKFQNFVQNVSRQSSRTVVDQVWDLLETEKNARKEKEVKISNEKPIQDKGKENGNDQDVQEEGVKRKHDKKSKLQNNPQHGDEDQKSVENSEGKECDVTKKKKKKKKRDKADNDDNDMLVNNGDNNAEMESEVSSEKPSKSKKKRKIEEDCVDASVLKKMKQNGENEDSVPEETKTGKFNWCKMIVKVLESADNNELSVKRLRKKVISEFSSTGAEVDESVYAKFAKKLSKIPVVVLLKDRAKLRKEH